MSTEYTHTDEDGDQLFVSSYEPGCALVSTTDTIFVGKDVAPALALAILRASGWANGTDSAVSRAVDGLVQYMDDAADVAEYERQMEARLDAQKLDDEALSLLNAAISETGREPFASLADTQSTSTRGFWRAAARKAREIHSK